MMATAYDNVNRDNIVVHELFKEVIEKVRKLSSGSLITPKSILIMIIIIPILAIVSFEVNPIHFEPVSDEALANTLGQFAYVKGLFNKSIDGDIIEDDLLDEDIYGERKIAQLGNDDIDIKMNLGFETDLTRPKDEDTEQIGFKDYPVEEDIEIVYDSEILQEHIEESDLARRYNERIRTMR
jgi:hypothetical protein